MLVHKTAKSHHRYNLKVVCFIKRNFYQYGVPLEPVVLWAVRIGIILRLVAGHRAPTAQSRSHLLIYYFHIAHYATYQHIITFITM